MYHLYQTRGFVLKSFDAGEADKLLKVYTKDLGLILGSARSARARKSKLAPALQEFCFSEFSLVRGKSGWRVASARIGENIFHTFRAEKEKTAIFARIFSLLERLLHGEEKNPKLFEILESALSFAKAEKLSGENLRNFEAVLVLRILKSLGYVGDGNGLQDFAETPFWSADIVAKIGPLRKLAFEEINKSLRESHL